MTKYICIMPLILILFTGCWDKVELDDRTFVLGAAIDAVSQNDKSSGKEYVSKDSPDIYSMTVETPVTKKISSSGEEVGGSPQQSKTAMLYNETGTSFFEILRKMATESDRVLFFGHQQVLVIGEELAMQRDLRKTLDFWGRDPEIDRSMDVYIAHGSAKDIFNANPRNSQTVSMFISDQSEQSEKTSRFISMDFVKLFSELVSGSGNLLIGGIGISSDNNLRVSSSGVIKEGRLVGWLDEDETRAAKFVMGEVKGGEIAFEDPENKGNFITVEILKVKTQLKAVFQNDIPHFTISIKIECNIVEVDNNSKSINDKTVERTQTVASAIMKNQIENTVEKLQKQYKADVLGFGEKLNKYYNKDWKKIKLQWDKIYPDVPVSVNVSTKVERIGRTY